MTQSPSEVKRIAKVRARCSTVTRIKVREIRAAYVGRRGPTLAELGIRFGMTGTAIHNIVARKRWADVE